MPTIENLNVGLNLQAAGFIGGIRTSMSMLGQFGLAVQGAKWILAGFESAFSSIADQLKKIDDVGDLAGNLGISTEELSRLQYAAKQTDSSVEALNNALKKMASSRPGQSFAESLDEVNKSLTRNETAKEIFGRGWVEISSLLRLSRDEIAALRKESDALGNTISSSMADAANDATNSIQRMEDAFEGLKNMFAVSFAPAVTESINQILLATRKLAVAIDVAGIGVSAMRGSGGGVARGLMNLRGSTQKLIDLEKAMLPKERMPKIDVNEEEEHYGKLYSRVWSDRMKAADELELESVRRSDSMAQGVGAASRFTSAGFSAVQQGKAQMEHLQVAKAQLAEEKKQSQLLKDWKFQLSSFSEPL